MILLKLTQYLPSCLTPSTSLLGKIRVKRANRTIRANSQRKTQPVPEDSNRRESYTRLFSAHARLLWCKCQLRRLILSFCWALCLLSLHYLWKKTKSFRNKTFPLYTVLTNSLNNFFLKIKPCLTDCIEILHDAKGHFQTRYEYFHQLFSWLHPWNLIFYNYKNGFMVVFCICLLSVYKGDAEI